MLPARDEFCGSTLLTINTSSRRPSMASATILSASPSPYNSAVSISVMPRSSPSFSAAISSSRRRGLSPMRHVPWPRRGTTSPPGSVSVGMLDADIKLSISPARARCARCHVSESRGALPRKPFWRQALFATAAAGALRLCSSRLEWSWKASTSRKTPNTMA
jgi:hypothetical protein